MKDTEKGAAIYSPLTLKLYDWWVLNVSNNFFWKCPTKDVLLPFFEKNLSKKHLDVGVGTGYYLLNTKLNSTYNITLMDLNENSLDATENRLYPLKVNKIKFDIMENLSSNLHEVYSSISIFYLLHCLPGTMEDKEIVFINLKKMMKKDGVIYGATILGEEIDHNIGGKKLMKIYNKKGIFGNVNDSLDKLESILQKNFEKFDIKLCGKVALFEARQPINF
ncbi:MAG: class I SAM-dependent methyltransferase [Acinetobacter sp.]